LWVLEEKSDGAVVDMFTTSELPWLDDLGGREGRIVQSSGYSVVTRLASSLVGFDKIARIL
jgi:hypothetical protein